VIQWLITQAFNTPEVVLWAWAISLALAVTMPRRIT
jgi:hypothetical protein